MGTQHVIFISFDLSIDNCIFEWLVVIYMCMLSCIIILYVLTVIKHDRWSYKSKKGTCHVFYMATPSHGTGSVEEQQPSCSEEGHHHAILSNHCLNVIRQHCNGAIGCVKITICKPNFSLVVVVFHFVNLLGCPN